VGGTDWERQTKGKKFEISLLLCIIQGRVMNVPILARFSAEDVKRDRKNIRRGSDNQNGKKPTTDREPALVIGLGVRSSEHEGKGGKNRWEASDKTGLYVRRTVPNRSSPLTGPHRVRGEKGGGGGLGFQTGGISSKGHA